MASLTTNSLIIGFASLIFILIVSRIAYFFEKRSEMSREMANLGVLAIALFITSDLLVRFMGDLGVLPMDFQDILKYSLTGLVLTVYIFYFSKFSYINQSLQNIAVNQEMISTLKHDPIVWRGYYNQGEFKTIRESLSKLEKVSETLRKTYSLNAERLVEVVENIKKVLHSVLAYYFRLNDLNRELVGSLNDNSVFWRQTNEILRHQNSTLIKSLNQMEESNKLVDHLNDQINLVAINAAIEASQAEKQGEGFVLVAENIRSLSVKSRESSKQLNETIKRLSSEILIDQRDLMEKTEKINIFLSKIEELSKQISTELETTIDFLESIDKSIDQVINIETELKSIT